MENSWCETQIQNFDRALWFYLGASTHLGLVNRGQGKVYKIAASS
jgi:hypothetical protein